MMRIRAFAFQAKSKIEVMSRYDQSYGNEKKNQVISGKLLGGQEEEAYRKKDDRHFFTMVGPVSVGERKNTNEKGDTNH